MYIKDITVIKESYNGNIVTLDRVCMDFNERINVIYGEPGSGKTTLLETIAGLEKPFPGIINMKGNIILMMQVPERQFIYPCCSMELGLSSDESSSVKTGSILSSVGLSGDILPLSPWQLSKGEKKRLLLARILKHDVSETQNNIFLLDDPFLDLDMAGKSVIINKIIREEKFKVIMAISNNYDLQLLNDKKINYKLINLKDGKTIDYAN